MTTTSDGGDETPDTATPSGLQVSSDIVIRDAASDAHERKCFYCRQDRQKCEWEEGQNKCSRCVKLNYTCAVNNVPVAKDASRRILRFNKCSFCRQAKRKCLPVDRIMPARCDRCVAKNLACSEPQKAGAEARQRVADDSAISTSPFSASPRGDDDRPPGPSSKQQKTPSRLANKHATPDSETPRRDDGYTPLDRGGFRVLELKQGSGDDEILYELHPWNKQIQYDALSYLRSFDEGKQVVMLNAKRKRQAKKIMPNIYAALLHLRLKDKSRFLWINALCINHGNTNERNVQVHVVHKIFNQASKVCLWLGETDGSTDGETRLAFEFAGKLLAPTYFDKAAKDVTVVNEWRALLGLISHPLFERRWIVQEVAVAGQATIHYGHHIMNWSEFEDVVTMFEHAEKENHAISRLLRQSPDFNRHLDAIGDVQALGASQFINLTSNIFKRSNVDSNPGEVTESLLSLEDMVYRLASFKGWDPHDVVYACVSLSQEAHGTGFAVSEPTPTLRKAVDIFLSKLPHRKVNCNEKPAVLRSGQLLGIPKVVTSLLRNEGSNIESKREIESFLSQTQQDRIQYNVNYDLPVLTTYKEFIAHVLRESKSLGILCRPWAPSKHILADYLDGGVPSWIATLDRAAFAKSPTSAGHVRINADPLIGSPGKESYKASLGLPASWTYPDARSGRNCLLVDGFVLTTISERRTEALGGNIPLKWLEFGGWNRRDEKPNSKMVRKHAGLSLQQIPHDNSTTKNSDDELPPENLWRTLVADRGPNGSFAPVFYRRACQYAFKQSGIASVLNTEQLLDSGSPSIVKEFLRRVQEVVWNRQLIKTKRGYLGLAPDAADKGDMVCILYGCSVPVVIRELDGGGHVLVGECYVHGMMDGAALAVQTAEKIPKQTFTLR